VFEIRARQVRQSGQRHLRRKRDAGAGERRGWLLAADGSRTIVEVSALYDSIGRTYTSTRQPDPRIAAAIRSAIGQAETVLNVDAGAGSHEPEDLVVTAVDRRR